MSTTTRRGFATATTTETPDAEPLRKTNVCGIISLFSALVLLALPAIVFGAIGITETLRRDEEDGILLAVFGLLTGVAELALLILWLVQTDWTIGTTF
ncbi:DUF4190 domain-containing protein [Gordonia terrae]|uniref:DUF4190 domain-containing protein n=1 Tax=Gordonia terrae TaxID=2055 RepID=UPI003F6BE31F